MMMIETGCVPPEAGGARAGYQQDASEGLLMAEDDSGRVWAWNPEMGQWQLPHPVVWGDTLWDLSAEYYGQPSLDGVRAIHKVPQNYAIQGPSPDSGLIPGDVILIPNLSQPYAAPVEEETPLPDISVPDTPTAPPVVADDTPTKPVATTPLPDPPPPPAPQGNGDVVLTSAGNGAQAAEKTSWWTPGRVAFAAVATVGGAGLLWYMVKK